MWKWVGVIMTASSSEDKRCRVFTEDYPRKKSIMIVSFNRDVRLTTSDGKIRNGEKKETA